MNIHHYASPLGTVEIHADNRNITGVYLLKNEPASRQTSENPLIGKTCIQLDEYFAGTRKTFDLPLSTKGTLFQQTVWKQLQEIPYGQTISYAQLAKAIGNPKACRAAGSANGKNPISIIIPCHRVIAADGSLGGFASGLDRKKQLLDLEKRNTKENCGKLQTEKSHERKETVLKAADPSIAYGEQRYSYADYLTWTDDKMREIINGIVYEFSAPFRKHTKATATFFGKAWSYINRRKGKCEIYTAPFDVRLPTNEETADGKIYNVVQPDICVICDPSKLDERGCIGAPDLVVEVISPSTTIKDINLKFFLYEKSGVREYWVVHPNDKAVTVFLLQSEGKYNEGTTYEVIYGATQVPVHTLQGLTIELEELFED